MAHYEPPHQDLRCLQNQLFSSLVLKGVTVVANLYTIPFCSRSKTLYEISSCSRSKLVLRNTFLLILLYTLFQWKRTYVTQYLFAVEVKLHYTIRFCSGRKLALRTKYLLALEADLYYAILFAVEANLSNILLSLQKYIAIVTMYNFQVR